MTLILLVDDEPALVFLTQNILEKAGYEVESASNGAECFNAIKKHRPDLVLLDVQMPGENGWAVCRKLKADEQTKDIPIIMFTVRTSKESLEESLKCADGQVNKPFRGKDLLDTIKQVLGK